MTDTTSQTNAAARRLLRTYYKLNENHVDDELYESNDSDILGYLETLDEMEAENETFDEDEFELLLNRVKYLKKYYAIKEQLEGEFRQIYG
jgi:hypothetical protein